MFLYALFPGYIYKYSSDCGLTKLDMSGQEISTLPRHMSLSGFPEYLIRVLFQEWNVLLGEGLLSPSFKLQCDTRYRSTYSILKNIL